MTGLKKTRLVILNLSDMTGLKKTRLATLNLSDMTGLKKTRLAILNLSDMTGLKKTRLTILNLSDMTGLKKTRLAILNLSDMTGLKKTRLAILNLSDPTGLKIKVSNFKPVISDRFKINLTVRNFARLNLENFKGVVTDTFKNIPPQYFDNLSIKYTHMLPFKSILNIQKNAKTPLFLQIANGLMDNIKTGMIPKGTKLLGTRAMAGNLGVHRQTVVAAYDELTAQGWIETKGSSGTFVSLNIPTIKPVSLDKSLIDNGLKITTGFNFKKKDYLQLPILRGSSALGFDDGFPDIRFAPVDELARAYRSVLAKGYQKNVLFYGETKGEPTFRQEMTAYLKETRGLNISTENVMISRGSMMAIYLTAQTVLSAGDRVVVGELGYGSGNLIFQNAGAELVKIRVDDKGLDVEQLAEICKTTPIRMVYITPHHHYPTTVTMPADRRLRLLELAKTYQFCILEDDYDYDFHYSSSPILPLASVDTEGYVIYVGSLCKTISPALRVGYIVAPSDLIEEMGNLRRIIDRQGDNMLEAALAILFKDGTIKRHLKKAQKAYHKRRDLFCDLLKTELGDVVDFKKPNGGLAVWVKFDPSVFLPNLSEKLKAKGLTIANGSSHNTHAIRMGFASRTEEEIEKGIDLIRRTI